MKKDIDWPLCMQSFAKMDEIVPTLKKLGFVDINIDCLMGIESVIKEGDKDNDHDDGNKCKK